MRSLKHCVSCGRRIEYVGHGEESRANHHCSARHEAAVEAASRGLEERAPRERSFAQRLEEGFAMLGAHFELLAPEDQIIPSAS
jgi:hypothetical protein